MMTYGGCRQPPQSKVNAKRSIIIMRGLQVLYVLTTGCGACPRRSPVACFDTVASAEAFAADQMANGAQARVEPVAYYADGPDSPEGSADDRSADADSASIGSI